MRRDDVIDERVAVVARESCLLMRDEKRWLPEQRETRVLKNLSYENVFTFRKNYHDMFMPSRRQSRRRRSRTAIIAALRVFGA